MNRRLSCRNVLLGGCARLRGWASPCEEGARKTIVLILLLYVCLEGSGPPPRYFDAFRGL